jgi:hypothetical protein
VIDLHILWRDLPSLLEVRDGAGEIAGVQCGLTTANQSLNSWLGLTGSKAEKRHDEK